MFRLAYWLSLALLLGLSAGLFSENYNQAGFDIQKFRLLFLGVAALLGVYSVHMLRTLTVYRPWALAMGLLVVPLAVAAALGAGSGMAVVALAGVVTAGVVIYQHDQDRALRTVGLLLAVALATNALYALGSSGGRMEQFDGAWRGLLAHKNRLGGLAGVGVLLAVMHWRVWGRLPVALLATGAACLLGSRSAGALICTVTVLLVYGVLTRVRRPSARIGLTGALLTIGALGSSRIPEALTSVFGSLGKDASLTGRGPLWQTIIEHGSLGPLYGLNSYWNIDSVYATSIAIFNGWQPFYSHNGYLEMLIIYGLPLTLVILGIILWCIVGIVSGRGGPAGLIVLFLAIYSFSEAALTQYDNPLSVLLVLVVLMALRGQTVAATTTRPTLTLR